MSWIITQVSGQSGGTRILGSNPPTAEMAVCGASIVLSGTWMGMTQPWSVILSTVFMRPPTIDDLQVSGVISKAVFDGNNDYLELPGSHPLGDGQLLSFLDTRKFWDSSKFHPLRIGSAAGRILMFTSHGPIPDSTGMGLNNQYDRIEKEIPIIWVPGSTDSPKIQNWGSWEFIKMVTLWKDSTRPARLEVLWTF